MSKIGICGAQSVGKTTLLNALRSEEYFKDYAVRDEVTRSIKAMGIDINEAGSDLSQKLIMKEHICNVFMYDKLLTDRTALDGLVYTKWLHSAGKVSQSTLDFAINVCDRVLKEFDYIFYIKPEFDIVDDGVRSSSAEWQNDIFRLFDETIKEYNIPIINIGGSVRERVDMVLKAIGAIYE